MEARVEHRDVRDVWQYGLGGLDRAQRRGGMQRGERLDPKDLRAHLTVDHDRLSEPRASVHDTVRHGPDKPDRRGERVEPLRAAIRPNEMQLQARRPGVDDEHVQ